MARFTLRLKDGTHTLELATNKALSNTTTDTTISGYTMTLKKLSPYPGDSKEEPPAADLRIEYR